MVTSRPPGLKSGISRLESWQSSMPGLGDGAPLGRQKLQVLGRKGPARHRPPAHRGTQGTYSPEPPTRKTQAGRSHPLLVGQHLPVGYADFTSTHSWFRVEHYPWRDISRFPAYLESEPPQGPGSPVGRPHPLPEGQVRFGHLCFSQMARLAISGDRPGPYGPKSAASHLCGY